MLKTLILASILTLGNINLVVAQITPDNTLGSENSSVTEGNINGLPSDIIENGAIRGGNLFHSFSEFNVNEGRGAYFQNPTGIDNILSRVTGNNISNINGTLGVLGNANLFLINPHGIVFGPNAKLDLNGAFSGSTADGIMLGENGVFDAINPSESNLLSVQPGVYFRNAIRDYTAKIETQNSNLTVGGNLTLEGDLLNISGNLTSGGDLILSSPNNNLLSKIASGNFLSGGNFRVQKTGDNSLATLASNGAVIHSLGDVSLNYYYGGPLHILAAGKVEIPFAVQTIFPNENLGITENITLGNGQVINIDSKIQNTVDIRAGVKPEAISTEITSIYTPNNADINIGLIVFRDGNSNKLGGNVLLTNNYQPNPNLTGNITNNAVFTSGTYRGLAIETGSDNGGGLVAIDSRNDITLNGSIKANSSALGGDVFLNSGGNVLINNNAEINVLSGGGGNININAKNLELTQGNLLAGINSNLGDSNTVGGDINIDVTETVKINQGFIANWLWNGSQGQGGKINITANSLELVNRDQNFSNISTQNAGAKGNTGDININTETVKIEGDTAQITSDISFRNITDDQGNEITIKGEGTAGNININTNSLEILNKGSISSNVQGIGTGGSVIINAKEKVIIDGDEVVDVQGQQIALGSEIITRIDSGGQGKAGNIQIETPYLQLTNGGYLAATTQGEGDAGTINIKADRLLISGETRDGVKVSNIDVSVQAPIPGYRSIGQGGSVKIETNSLELLGGGQILAATFAEGNAGDVNIKADNILIDGINSKNTTTSGTATSTEFGSFGNGGNTTIETNTLTITNGGQISGGTKGSGNGGNLKITATESILVDGESIYGISSLITNSVQSEAKGNAGTLEINTNFLSLTNNGQISSASFGVGDAGFVNITAKNITLDGANSAIASSSFALGDGGSIDITTESLNLVNGSYIQANTFGQGDAGKVKISAQNITLDGEDSDGFSTLITSQVGENAKGNAGEIIIDTDKLTITNGAGISGSTFGEGNGANIEIEASEINFDGTKKNQEFGSGVFSRAGETATGNGGNVNITTNNLNLTNGAEINLTSEGTGTGGNITLIANTLNLDNGTISAATNSADGGSIDLNIANILNLKNGSEISATAGLKEGAGNGGNINLFADYIINYPRDNKITANAFEGNGGNINITTNGIFGSQYLDITASSQFGLDGEININLLKADPTGGLFVNNESGIDIAALFAKNFCNVVGDSTFVYIGRAGRVLTQDDEFEDYQTFLNWVDNPIAPNGNQGKKEGDREIVQTQGWLKLSNGTMVLTAHPVEVDSEGVKFLLGNCK